MERKLISIVMGSDSDLPVMKQAAEILDIFGIGYEIDIVSAHRTPEKLYEFASKAHNKGFVV
ncbi:MAG: AIR carboxylase family protein, partial [Bacteroidales bacterium]